LPAPLAAVNSTQIASRISYSLQKLFSTGDLSFPVSSVQRLASKTCVGNGAFGSVGAVLMSSFEVPLPTPPPITCLYTTFCHHSRSFNALYLAIGVSQANPCNTKKVESGGGHGARQHSTVLTCRGVVLLCRRDGARCESCLH